MEDQVQNEEGNPFDEFPEQVVEDVNGLVWLGHLEDHVEFCGHTFTLRTLKGDEELMAALLVKDFSDTIGQAKAWAWANIALSLSAVDGEEDFCPPIGPDKKAHARARFQYVTSKWYWPVGEYLFAQYAALVQRQADAVRALQDLSSRSLPTSMPWVDSWTDRADSEDPSTPSSPSS